MRGVAAGRCAHACCLRHRSVFAQGRLLYLRACASVLVPAQLLCSGHATPTCSPAAAHADNEYFATFYSDNVPYAQYFDSKRASHALSQDPGRRQVAHAWPAVRTVTSGTLEAAGCCAAASRLGMLAADSDQIAWQAALQLLLAEGGIPSSSRTCLALAAALSGTDAIESVFDAVSYQKGAAAVLYCTAADRVGNTRCGKHPV